MRDVLQIGIGIGSGVCLIFLRIDVGYFFVGLVLWNLVYFRNKKYFSVDEKIETRSSLFQEYVSEFELDRLSF